GEIDDAIDSSRRAAAIVATHSQADSFRNATALHARGAALLAARRLDEALPDLAQATAIVSAHFPTTNEYRRPYQAHHALALALAGRPKEAEPIVAPFVTATESRPLYVMGVINRRQQDYRAALQCQQRALTMMPGGRSTEIDRMRALTEIGLD